MSRELKVGFLFFLALGLAVVFAVLVRPDWHAKGDLTITFPRVSRLKQGDQVTYNGVRVGQVADVSPVLQADGSAAVAVRFSIEVRHRDRVLVDGRTRYRIVQGILGGAVLDIVSDGGKPVEPTLLAGARGSEPASLDETIASVQAMIEENRAEIRRAIAAIRSGAENLGGMAGEVRDAVAENRQQLKTTIRNIGDASKTIDETVSENRVALKSAIENIRIMADQAGQMISENREQVRAAVANVAGAGGEIRDAVKENRDNLKAITDSFARFGPKLERIGDNLEVITAQISQGKGTVGKLVMDDRLHDQALAMVDNANQRLEEVKPVTQGMTELKFYGGVDGGTDFSHGVSVGTAYLRIEPRPWKYYEMGVTYRTAPKDVYPAREDPDKLHIDFNIQLGWRFLRDEERQRYRLTVSGGLLESQIGVRVETPIPGTDDLSFWLTARKKQSTREEIDRRYEDGKVLGVAAVSWRLWNRIYLNAGCYDCFERPGLYGGIRGEILDSDLRNIFAAAVLMK